jgi:hypothetical protein
MIIPNRIVQAERLVTLAPAVARPFVFFDDDGRHIELAQPGSECDAALTTTNDDAIGLTRVAEFSSFRLSFFLPRFSIAFKYRLDLPVMPSLPDDFRSAYPVRSADEHR